MVLSITEKLPSGHKRSVDIEPDTMVAKREEKTLLGNHNNKNVQPSGQLGQGKDALGDKVPT